MFVEKERTNILNNYFASVITKEAGENLPHFEVSGKNLFWSINNPGENLDKLKARDFNATSLSTYDLFYSFHYFTS